MELLSEIQNRRSALGYLSQPVTRDAAQRIMEAGRLAPSAKNRQAWRFVAVDEPRLIARIGEAAYGQDCVTQAPLVIALCTTNVDYKMPNGQLSYPVDLGVAAAFMLLQATHEGLGSCAVSTFSEADVKSILTVPYGMRVVLLVTVGHAREITGPRDRLPGSRVMSFNSW